MKFDEWLVKMFSRISQFSKLHPEVLIFFLVTIFAFGGFVFEMHNNTIVASGIQKNLLDADTIISKRLAVKGKLDSINSCMNLKTVYYYLDNIKKAKFELAKKYQGFVVTCYSLGVFFVALGAIIGFIITKRGWDNSTRYRKAIFLSFALYGIILSTFPKLFNQEQNYKANFSDYNAISKLQLYIFFKLSPYIDREDIKLSKSDSVVLNSTIDTVSTVLSQHSNIDMNFDVKQLENIKTFEMDKK